MNLLHLRARWYLVETGTFLSRDPWMGDMLAPRSLFPSYQYVNGNPVNLTDPSGLFAWYDIRNIPTQGKHERIERWFERDWAGANGFWKTHLEFNKMPGSLKRPDIIYFPDLVPSKTSSPIDFSQADWDPVGEIYEIEPMYPKDALDGFRQVLGYYTHLSVSGFMGGLRGKIPFPTDAQGKDSAPYGNQTWDFNNINWELGTSFDIGPHVVPMSGQGDIWLVRPVPGLILYVDDRVRQTYEAVGITLGVTTLVKTAHDILKAGTSLRPSPAPACVPFPYIPEFYFDWTNPNHPFNCPNFPFCEEKTKT